MLCSGAPFQRPGPSQTECVDRELRFALEQPRHPGRASDSSRVAPPRAKRRYKNISFCAICHQLTKHHLTPHMKCDLHAPQQSLHDQANQRASPRTYHAGTDGRNAPFPPSPPGITKISTVRWHSEWTQLARIDQLTRCAHTNTLVRARAACSPAQRWPLDRCRMWQEPGPRCQWVVCAH